MWKKVKEIHSTSCRVFECILMIGSFTNHISIGSRNFHCCEVTWSYIRIHIGSSVSTVLQDSEPSAPIHHINGNTSITTAMFATGSLQAHSRSRCPIWLCWRIKLNRLIWFFISNSFQVHKRVHEGSSTKMFGCEPCEHYFVDCSAYYNHAKRRHGEKIHRFL